jgi:hypothetical protein
VGRKNIKTKQEIKQKSRKREGTNVTNKTSKWWWWWW